MDYADPYGRASHVISLAGGKLRRATCKRCGDADVAWAQSKRTGKWYLCQVFSKAHSDSTEATRAAPWKLHQCITRTEVG